MQHRSAGTARFALAGLLGLALFVATTEAGAFCRSTTCKAETEDCQPDEHGCSRLGAPHRWRAMPLVYRFSSRRSGLLLPEEARAAIRAAFHRWSDTRCSDGRTSLRFVEGDDIAEDKPLEAQAVASEPFGIFYRDLGWPYLGKQDSTLAQTNTRAGKKSGFIEYADIEINSGARRFSLSDAPTDEDLGAGADLQAVMTHEVGHYIGLAHSDEPSSIMVADYCDRPDARCSKGKAAARRLSQDDIDAVCTIYPPGARAEAGEPPSESGCAVASGASSTSSTLLVLCAVAGCALALARRCSTWLTR